MANYNYYKTPLYGRFSNKKNRRHSQGHCNAIASGSACVIGKSIVVIVSAIANAKDKANGIAVAISSPASSEKVALPAEARFGS